MTSTNNHIDNHDEVQSLIDSIESTPADFEHLKIFLNRNGKSNCLQDKEYLMVTPNVFGKVKVLDLKVNADYIIIEFLDCAMQMVGNVRVDINDSNPKTLFICWQDIKRMVLDETSSMSSNDGLLDFDF